MGNIQNKISGFSSEKSNEGWDELCYGVNVHTPSIYNPHPITQTHTPRQTKEAQANKHQAEVIDIIYNALAHHPVVYV